MGSFDDAILAELASPRADVRERALGVVTPSEVPCAGVHVLLATVCLRDGCARVRAAALERARQICEMDGDGVPPPAAAGAFARCLRDPDDDVRCAAYRLWAAARIPNAFRTLCTTLALETTPAVRSAGFAALRVTPRPDSTALRMALCYEEPTKDAALARTNYAGVLADALFDADEDVRKAAIRALQELVRGSSPRERLVACELATRLLENPRWRALRDEALRVVFHAASKPKSAGYADSLSPEDAVQLDLAAASAIARAIGSERSVHLLCDVVRSIEVRNLRAFCRVVEAVEDRMERESFSATVPEEGSCTDRIQGASGSCQALQSALDEFSRRNRRWAHVLDLGRLTSDKLMQL